MPDPSGIDALVARDVNQACAVPPLECAQQFVAGTRSLPDEDVLCAIGTDAPDKMSWRNNVLRMRDLRALLAERDRLAGECARLREDAARLDFLERKRDDWVEHDGNGEPYLVAHTWEVERNRIAAQTETLRQAIDEEMLAARASTPDGGTEG
jgi:hypothetical protein